MKKNYHSGKHFHLSASGSFKGNAYKDSIKIFFLICLFFYHPAVAQEKKPVISKDTTVIALRRDSLNVVRLIYNNLPANLSASSTQTVYTKDLTQIPAASVLNTLVARFAGLSTTQSSGQPNNDAVSPLLRGQTPLILVDGIARSLTEFDPNEIESITVLKDALATATLGVRASDNAILITTKRGTNSRQSISFSARTSFQSSINPSHGLDAYHYALLYDEALKNDGLAPVYSSADLQGYLNKTDPFKYPDVNWLKQLTNNSSRFDQYALNTSGGNRYARYFVSLEDLKQTGIYKTSSNNPYNTNNDLSRYNVRSNVDLNITNRLTGGISLFGSIKSVNSPGSLNYTSIVTTPNNAYPIYNPNGSYAGNQQFTNNLEASSISSGYLNNYYRTLSADFYLKRELDDLLPGLWVKAVGSYYSYLNEQIDRSKTLAVYQAITSPTGVISYNTIGTNGIQKNAGVVSTQNSQSYFEFSTGYHTKIDKVHGVDVLLLANRDNYVTMSNLPYTIQGLSGRAAYNFNEKYIAEFAFGYNGSNYYPPSGNYKYGFFPAAGLAWNINKEGFMQDIRWVNQLKLFVSYGKTGNDNQGYFQYQQGYQDGSANYLGTSASSTTTQQQMPLADPNRTFEKANKLNLGLQGSLLDNKLAFTFEYFNDRYYDLLETPGFSSLLLGTGYPQENIGINRYDGMDVQLSWQENKHKLNYNITLNAGLLGSKAIYMDEAYQQYDWMKHTGKKVGMSFGYVAEGLFQSQSEINGAATIQGYNPQPGDIRYKDLNGDGIINQFDVAPIGNPKPLISFGLSLGVNYKGFDLSAIFQGVENRSIYLGVNSYWAFQNNGFGQAYENNLDRWTPDNPGATYPRLNIGTNINNQAASSYWYRNGSYLRAKNIELGYNFPGSLLRSIKLESARIFVSGTNLFTWSSLGNIDPETFQGQYPIQKMMTVGASIKF
jgi:TonB-linked SusC/RagA family outer membrane protein